MITNWFISMPTLALRKTLATTTMVVLALLLGACAAEFHHRDGLYAMKKQDYEAGIRHLAEAARLRPNDLEIRNDWLRAREQATARLLKQATDAFALGRSKDAERAYYSILQYDQNNAMARSGLEVLRRLELSLADVAKAKEALQEGDIEQATEAVDRALKNSPDLQPAKLLKRELDGKQNKDAITVPRLGAMYKKPINLEFRESNVKMIFDALSRTTGINFIFDRDVRFDQRTTISLKNTTLDDAIDVVLSTNALDKKILNANSVLIYPNNSQKQKEYQDLVVKAFYMANIDAKRGAEMLKTILKVKDIYIDEKYNMFVLRESPQTIALAEKLVALHDLEEPEVMLEVEVLEINRSNLLNLGLQVNSQFTVAPLNDLVSNTGSGTGSTASTGGGQTIKLNDFKNINSNLLGVTLPSATLSLRKTDGDAKLLANPSIRVRDREKAKFMVGDKVPVVTTTSTGTYVSENINYVDVGLKLDVEPDIHLRDEIGLKINLEVSSIVSTTKTNNGSQAYQIGTRNFSSALRLKDGETQILGGLISDEDRKSANRIPFLGDLPILGRLFSNQTDSTQKTEIVLSITPHLVRNMRRIEASSEAFWSGTEQNLRSKPIMLRNAEEVEPTKATGGKADANTNATKPSTFTPDNRNVQTVVPENPNAPKMSWAGNNKLKKGELGVLDLELSSPYSLRGASLQLAFVLGEIEIVSVVDGQFFGKEGKANFGHTIDVASGRVSIGVSGAEGTPVNQKGQIAKITYKMLKNSGDSDLSLISMTPIGLKQAVDRPALPLLFKVSAEK